MRRRFASRLAWSLWGAALLLQVAWLTLQLSLGDPRETNSAVAFAPMILAFGTVGALIASRRPDNRIGWIYLASQVQGALIGTCLVYLNVMDIRDLRLPGAIFAAWLANWMWYPLIVTFLFLPLLLFPTGKLVSPRWRIVALAILVFAGLHVVLFALVPVLDPGISSGLKLRNPIGVPALGAGVVGRIEDALGLGFVLLVVLALSSMVDRWRRSKGMERQQLKWFAAAGVLITVGLVFDELLGIVPQSIGDLFFPVLISTLPVASGIAILKHGLLDIDVVINKAVVYGILATFITAVFAVVVVGPAVLIFGAPQWNLLLPLIATAAIGIAFQPARRRAQELANRLVYGQRVTPYEAMAEFSHQMAGSLSIEQVLPRIAETAARGVGASRTHVAVLLPSGEERSADWPASNGQVSDSYAASVPVVYRDERIGEIAVAKPPTDPLTVGEQKLLHDLASQAGSALANVRLTEELRASRQRLVKAQDEERRKLERNLHDGAQQQLVALKVQLGLASRLADPESKIAPMLSKLAEDADGAIDNLRELARGIYPPLLADRGLADAVSSHAQKLAIPVAVSADSIGRHPQEVEAAIYYCCLEALQNVSKYAEASEVQIHFVEKDGFLEFSVKDKGRGFDLGSQERGAGLQNMSDRIDALGGTLTINSAPGKGTRVTGSVPITEARSE